MSSQLPPTEELPPRIRVEIRSVVKAQKAIQAEAIKPSKSLRKSRRAANKSLPVDSNANKSNISAYFLAPFSNLSPSQTLTEQIQQAEAGRYDPELNLDAEVQSKILPSLIVIAREIRMRLDVPMNLRNYLAGSSASWKVGFDLGGKIKVFDGRGDPYIRSFLFGKLKGLDGDPIVAAAFVNAENEWIRIGIRIRTPENDGNHCLESDENDFDLIGHKISFNFRPQCKERSVLWNVVAVNPGEPGASPDIGLNLLSILQIAAHSRQKEIEERELNRDLKILRQSPAFSMPIGK